MTSCQQYQSGTWTECQGSVCKDNNWVELTGYSFAGQVVNEDDLPKLLTKRKTPQPVPMQTPKPKRPALPYITTKRAQPIKFAGIPSIKTWR